MSNAKITAIVVTCNDSLYLERSLKSLAFCDQVIVVDLESTDSSVRIAKELGADVLLRERVPVVEQARLFAMSQVRHEWLLFQDPDEVIPYALACQVKKALCGNPNLSMIKAPIQFYFKGKPLTFCIWGVPWNKKTLIVHRDRVSLKPHVHKGYEAVEGFDVLEIKRERDNYIQHYWMESWTQLVEKHKRYIQKEGEARYKSGQRFSWAGALYDSCFSVAKNLIYYKGLWGGATGISLSFFYGWYIFMSHLSLRAYEQKKDNSA